MPWQAWVALIAVLTVIGLGIYVAVQPTLLEKPPPAEAAAIENRLLTQGPLGPIQAPAMFWVLRLPETAGDRGDLVLGARSAELVPTRGTIDDPQAVLQRSGWYLAVSTTPPAGQPLGLINYIVPLGDPRIVVSERPQGNGVDATVLRVPGGTLSGRAPYIPEGILHIFEVTSPNVNRVLLRVPLAGDPYRESGKRFLVPFS